MQGESAGGVSSRGVSQGPESSGYLAGMANRNTNVVKLKRKLSHSEKRGKKRTRNSKKTGTQG